MARGPDRARPAVSRVALLLNDDRLAGTVASLPLGAQAQEREQPVPEPTHDTAGTDGQQDDHASQRPNDDASNGTSAERGAARGRNGCAVSGACRGGALGGPRGGGCGPGAGAGDAVRRAVLGGDSTSMRGHGRREGRIGGGLGVGGARVGHALAFVCAVLPGGAAYGAAGDVAGTGRRGAGGGAAAAASGDRGGRSPVGSGTCESLGFGPGCGVQGLAAAVSLYQGSHLDFGPRRGVYGHGLTIYRAQWRRGRACAPSSAVRSGADLTVGAAVLVGTAAV